MKMEKINATEITWYENGNFVEWWENDDISPIQRKFDNFSLKETIEIAKKNKLLLVIQPELQDQCIFIDFS